MSSDPIIQLSGLRKAYGDVVVLDGVDLSVARNTIHALLGPNGAGKTTMVRILSTLIRPDAGTAVVDGHSVVEDPRGVRRTISLTGQYAAVDELLTGEENLRMMARLHHLGRAEGRRRSADLLERFELVDAKDRPVKTYSGGMRRRLDIAVSLLGHPSVVFLDEPTTGLDPRSRRTMWEVIRGLVADGTTVLLTTQYLEEADELADRISVLHRGGIIAEGTAAVLKGRLDQERLELVLPDDGAFDRAVHELGGWAGLGAHAVQPDRDTTVIGVGTDGSADHVRAVLDHLAARGVPVSRVGLVTPSLDEVFLRLTGDDPTDRRPTHTHVSQPEELRA
ncbi:ATP-binding cassette domain-containing protein [Georgenia sp. TF02-10]|uniref:ATP-binding cassette domain-containing protein n=1 Tax=Georgenia sp. TF02-10 TaxID=2917725 RepID=UPI001FA7D7EF|nr:ATP-binding cassette domain-containing protein [Georgenia sp. TF02-10]UNX55049.1 ATP-binding cassette domain-containing protein [Georgenia sp. TF02-10]